MKRPLALTLGELAARARSLMEEGLSRKDAMAQVVLETGASRRLVFDALIEPGEPGGG